MLKTKHYLFFCMSMVPFWLSAQVIINAQLPPGGMIQKEQLWNLTIVNSLKDFSAANLKLTLQDVSTGQIVLSSVTGAVMLGKGVTVITNAAVQPVSYSYYTTDLPGNFLPIGAYIACYSVYYTQGESEEFLSDECIRFSVDPLSPPLLTAPGDKDTVQTPYPLFTWMPPTPINMFSELNYDIIVAEILDGQSANEAVENNTPIYTRNNLIRPNENYPASFTKLETGKTYAWQVIAKNGFNYAVKTDVWTFSIGKNPESVIAPLNNNYLLLENELKDTYIIINKQLQIKYHSFDIEHEASVMLSDVNGNEVFSIKKKIAQGDNYFTIALNSHFQEGKIYTVSITDLSGKNKAILFRIKK